MKQYTLSSEMMDAYEKYLSTEERSAGTIEKYLRDVRAFYGFLNGGSVTKDRIAQWKESLVTRNYAAVTVNSMLAALNGLFRFWDGKSAGSSF